MDVSWGEIMNIPGYSLVFNDVLKKIKKHKWERILLQIPEGIKHKAFEISDYIEQQTGADCFIHVDPCYGSCDLIPSDYVTSLMVDAVIQLGHLPIPSVSEKKTIPYFFVNVLSNQQILGIVNKALTDIEGKNIGIVTTAQHIHLLDDIISVVKEHGFDPVVSEGDNRIFTKGQILGCNFSVGRTSKDLVDSFLFVGSGLFHPLGLLLSVKKPVVVADPYAQQVKKEELLDLKDTILRQRYGAIAHAQSAQSFGILIGLKPGQMRRELAENIHRMLLKKNKQAHLLTVTHMNPSYLESFLSIDCFVSTLCPRVAIDDYVQYKTPIITPVELEIVLGKRSWDEYVFDEIIA